MAEYTLDLNDQQAEAIYQMARGNPKFGVKWADEFKTHIPIPVPSLPGAVVLTDNGVYVLARCGNHWVNEHDAGGHHELVTVDQLPPIIEVLSRGWAG